MPSLLERLRRWALRRLDGVPADAGHAVAPLELTPPCASYDEGLLERARLQWHVGDWDSLAALSHDEVSLHPDRAKLALLVAAALQQRDQAEAAARYVQLARSWGCSNKLIAQVLIAGVHNSLARASLLSGDEEGAQAHFRLAVAAGTPGMDSPLVVQMRAKHESNRIALARNETPPVAVPAPAPGQIAIDTHTD